MSFFDTGNRGRRVKLKKPQLIIKQPSDRCINNMGMEIQVQTEKWDFSRCEDLENISVAKKIILNSRN